MIVIQPRRPRRNLRGWVAAVLVAVVVLSGVLGGIVSACAAVSGRSNPLLGLLNINFGIETRDLPGDARAFTPFEALPTVTEYAGPGAKLVSIEIALVRADGTLDLDAPFTPKPDVTYTFAREVEGPANAPPPGAGGANAGPWHETVRIRAYEPGQRRRRTTTTGSGNSTTVQYRNKGLDRQTNEATTAALKFALAPTCRITDLWAVALQRGAPGDGVARIRYDAKGYEFTITGFQIAVLFDANCKERTR